MEKEQETSGKKAWWIFFGSLGVVAMLGCAVVYFGIVMPIRGYISSEPYPIQHIPASNRAEQAVLQKVTQFWNSPAKDTLSLDSREVNHLIRTSPKLQEYKVRYLIELQDSLFNLKCTVPVSTLRTHLSGVIKLLNLDGYVNAELEGYLRLRDRKLTLITVRSQMNGRQAPFTLLGKRTHLDLNKVLADHPGFQPALEQLGLVRIKAGYLEIVRN